MKGVHIVTVLALICFLMSGCVPEPELTNRRGEVSDEAREIFVLNSLAETISVIHPDKLAAGYSADECIFNDLVTTGGSPNHLFFLDGDLYLINSLSNTLGCYDEDTLALQEEYYLGRGTNPWQLIVDDTAAFGYVPCYVAGTVLKVDLVFPSGDPVELASGLALPEGGAICTNSGGDELLFVAECNNDGDGTVGRPGRVTVLNIHAETSTAIDLEPVGFDPDTDSGCNPQAVLTFDGLAEAHVVCTGEHEADDGEVVIINADTLAVDSRITLGGSPNGFPAGVDTIGKRVFLANNGYGITVYNFETREVLRGSGDPIVPDGSDGSYYTGVLYDGTTGYLFISDFSTDSIHVLSGSNFTTLASLNASDGPGYLLLVEE